MKIFVLIFGITVLLLVALGYHREKDSLKTYVKKPKNENLEILFSDTKDSPALYGNIFKTEKDKKILHSEDSLFQIKEILVSSLDSVGSKRIFYFKYHGIDSEETAFFLKENDNIDEIYFSTMNYYGLILKNEDRNLGLLITSKKSSLGGKMVNEQIEKIRLKRKPLYRQSRSSSLAGGFFYLKNLKI